jgi:hypothetical protein
MEHMAALTVEGQIPASVDDVWKLVSDFGGFLSAQGLPVEVEGEGVGAIRIVSTQGVRVVERLEAQDDEACTLTYHIVEGPMPFSDYFGTIALSPAGESATTLSWSARYQPNDDTDGAARLIEWVYQGGIKALQRHFGGDRSAP